MKKNVFDICRILQWLIPGLLGVYCVLDEVFGFGVSWQVSMIVAEVVALLGLILQHESDEYFKDKDIVAKASMETEGVKG